MGDQLDLPRINEAAAYVDRYDPAAKAALVKQGPEFAQLLDLGVIGGAAKATDRGARVSLSRQAEVLTTILDGAVVRAREVAERMRRKLALLRTVRFAAAALATIGASSVLGAVVLAPRATLAAGFFSLASNLAALGADKLVLGPGLKESDLIDAVATLIRTAAQGELAQRTLQAQVRGTFDIDEVKKLIEDANRLFAELNKALTLAPSLTAG